MKVLIEGERRGAGKNGEIRGMGMEARDPAERKSPVRVGKPRSTGDKASPSRYKGVT